MLRARPAAAFALLNHILINGFFFNQGFAICLFPSNTVLDFDHSVHARSPNERGAEPQGRNTAKTSPTKEHESTQIRSGLRREASSARKR